MNIFSPYKVKPPRWDRIGYEKNNMRTKPYTEIGIRRLKCFRCKKQAHQQWQICADNNQFRPICNECDLELNRFVLQFMGFKNWRILINRYDKKIYDSTSN